MQAKHALAIARHIGISVEELLTGDPSDTWRNVETKATTALRCIDEAAQLLTGLLKGTAVFDPAPETDTSNAPPEAHLKSPRSKSARPDPDDSRSVREVAPPYAPDPDGSRSVREVAPEYAPDAASDTIGPVPFAGRLAAGPPIDIERWPDEWRPIRLRRRESAQTHYLAQAVGTSMVDADIADGALVLVRRAEAAQHDQIVVVWLPGDGLTIKRYRLAGGRPVLTWEDGSGRTAPLREGARVQGVFVRVVE